jgi:hypothetical protein
MIKDRPANAETLAVSGNETELSHLRQLFAAPVGQYTRLTLGKPKNG